MSVNIERASPSGSSAHSNRWRVKLQHEVQSGYLRSKGEIQYEYQYMNDSCKIRKWDNHFPNAFEEIDYVLVMLLD